MTTPVPQPRRPQPPKPTFIALAVLGVFTGALAPAGAADYFWSSGSYATFNAPQASPNPIAGGDTVFASGAVDKNFASIVLDIQGTLAWQTSSRLGFSGSNLTNTGLIDIVGDASLVYIGGSVSTLANDGTFRKSAGIGTTNIGMNIGFVNSGIVDAQSGTIDFSGNGATFNAGTQFIGAGVNRVSGNAAFNGALTSSNLELTGGLFAGGDASIGGSVTWSGGQFGGSWTLPANQTLNAVAGGNKNFNGVTFNNAGNLVWGTSNRIGFQSSAVNNSGLIDIQADANLTYIGGSVSTLVNTATFRKSGGDGETVIGTNILFTNSGVIDAQSGTINFSGGSATFNEGTQFIGAGVNRISNSAAFNGAFTSANLIFAGGNFTGNSAVLNGTAEWTGGQFMGDWQLPVGQTLHAVTGDNKNFNSVIFDNAGTIVWETANRIGFVSSALNNAGLIDIQGDANLTYVGGSASTLINTGTFRKSTGGGSSTIGVNVQFSNTGIIDAQTGTINFSGGSATFNAGTQFVGAGVNRISDHATFSGAFTSANLVLEAGTYGSVGPSGATILGAVGWRGGQFLGTWALPSGQTVTATGPGEKNFNAVAFTNDGIITWDTASRIGFVSSTLRNNGLVDIAADANISYVGGSASNFINTAGATLRKSAGAGSSIIGTNVVFQNAGTIEAQSGTIDFSSGSVEFLAGTRFIGAGVVRVNNDATFSGAFDAANLTLASGSYSGTNAVLNGAVRWTGGQMVGSWQVDAGQTLTALTGGNKNFNTSSSTLKGTVLWQTEDRLGFVNSAVTNQGLFDIQADANLTYVGGSASTFVNEGVLRKSGGTGLTIIGGSNIAFSNPGTIEALSGTIVLPANFTNPGTIKGTASVQTNTLTNTGVIAPGASPGTLTLVGNLVMSDAGRLDIEIESNLLHDVLAVTGSALLDGTLVVRRFGDYAPSVGDSFTILTYASRVGQSEFDSLSTLGFGSGVLFDVAYGANAVTLSVAAVPEPESYALMLLGLAWVAWAVRRQRQHTSAAAA